MKLEDFGLSAERGYLSSYEIDAIELPEGFDEMLDAAAQLSDIMTTGRSAALAAPGRSSRYGRFPRPSDRRAGTHRDGALQLPCAGLCLGRGRCADDAARKPCHPDRCHRRPSRPAAVAPLFGLCARQLVPARQIGRDHPRQYRHVPEFLRRAGRELVRAGPRRDRSDRRARARTGDRAG